MPSPEHLPRAIWAEPRWLQFLEWDAGPDLAQATWEWPDYVNYASADGAYPSLKRPSGGLWRAIQREVKAANCDWERRGKHEFKRQLYGN